MIYNETYTLALKIANTGCTNVFPGHKGANNFLWFISRGMTDYFWMYPFLYIFWPKAVKMEVRTVSSASGSHQDIEVVTTYDEDDSDDEVESMYPSSARTWSNMRSLVRSYTFSVHQAQQGHSSSPIKTSRPLSTRLDPVMVSNKDFLTSPPTSDDKVGSCNMEKDQTTERSPVQSLDSLDRDLMQNFLMNNPSSNEARQKNMLATSESDCSNPQPLEFVYQGKDIIQRVGISDPSS